MTAVLPADVVTSSFEQIVRRRRATPHFTGEEVPAEVITTALRLAVEAPSGYNLQSWQFVVARNKEVRRRLQRAAQDQEKITEA
ncbi:MAG TPA: nitroreductase family protein [Lacunisphaera sp.]|jgi:nitroreductase|nr:nitroreductase family protein [Lacunisphaera sp.]